MILGIMNGYGAIGKDDKMVKRTNRRVTITLDRKLDDTINEFLENSGPSLQITSKSQLFTLAIIELFSVWQERIENEIKKKGEK